MATPATPHTLTLRRAAEETPPPASPPARREARPPHRCGGPSGLAVEVSRTIPASGNLGICGLQFWLGPVHAGREITAWAGTTVVHLLLDGVRRKTVPSRLSLTHLHQLLADDGRPAGPPPVSAGPVQPGTAIEVDRTINATGLLALTGRQHPVGFHLARRRPPKCTREARRSDSP